MPRYDGSPTRAEKKAANRAKYRGDREVGYGMAAYADWELDQAGVGRSSARGTRRRGMRKNDRPRAVSIPAGWFTTGAGTFRISASHKGGFWLSNVDGGERKFKTAEQAFAATAGRGPRPTYDL